jgi:phage replication initiation protein
LDLATKEAKLTLVTKNGIPWEEVPVPIAVNSKVQAFVDTVSFTFSENYYPDSILEKLDLTISLLSQQLNQVLGYGLSKERPPLRCYKQCFKLGNQPAKNWGLVGLGGKTQARTILVQIYGEGCVAAARGWENRLFHWLQQLPRMRLTRVDLAIDVEAEFYSVEQANRDWEAGKFNLRGRLPRRERVNFDNPHEGRTVYIGSRQGGKYARIYEKGKQLGDPYSNRVRVEVEWHNQQRLLPADMLVNTNQYLAGAYPLLRDLLQEAQPLMIPTQVKTHQIAYEKSIELIKRQFGAYIYAMQLVEESPQTIIDKLARPAKTPHGLPPRLLMPHWDPQSALEQSLVQLRQKSVKKS